jgi:hypothetical protein
VSKNRVLGDVKSQPKRTSKHARRVPDQRQP